VEIVRETTLDLYTVHVIDKPLQSEMRIISKTTKNIIEGLNTMATSKRKWRKYYSYFVASKKNPLSGRGCYQ
jgi:hypothetical protein